MKQKIIAILFLMVFVFFYSSFAENETESGLLRQSKDFSSKEIFDKGSEYLKNKKYDEAIAEFNKIIKINPNYAEAYNSRGSAYSKKR